MTEKMQIITAAGIVTGVIIVGMTGLLWPIVPIVAAVYMARLAAQATDEKPEAAKPTKGSKKK